jgi:hypothetical protein
MSIQPFKSQGDVGAQFSNITIGQSNGQSVFSSIGSDAVITIY